MDVSTDADQVVATTMVVASLPASPPVTSGQLVAEEVRCRWLDQPWSVDAQVTTFNNKSSNKCQEVFTVPSIPLEAADGMMLAHPGEQQVSRPMPASTTLRAKESL